MNREIKFRAYCDIGDENKMLYFTEGKYDNGLWFEHTSNHIDEYLSPLMQYTGLKDKNGIEIYEGDILKHPLSTEPEHLGFIIGFRDYRTIATNLFTNEESDFNIYFSNYDIIGNIHQTPELWK